MLKNNLCNEFQNMVSEYLIRHKSIIDVMSKLQESNARINRALAKSITVCGCLQVNAKKQNFPLDSNLSELKNYTQSHLEGALCPNCAEVLENEIGSNLFYIAALCDLLGLNLQEVLKKEHDKIATLGIYNLS